MSQDIGVEREPTFGGGDEERLAELEATVRRQAERIDALEARLNELETCDGTDGSEYPHELARLAAMEPLERDRVLDRTDQSKRRAVKLYEQWDRVAWTLGGGSTIAGNRVASRSGINTAATANRKYNPSKAKVELEKILDADLEWPQVYRTLKAVARLSGGTLTVDDHGRERVYGGEFIYEERAAGDNDRVFRVLYRDTEGDG